MRRDRRPRALVAPTLLFLIAGVRLDAQLPQAVLDRDAQMAQLAVEAATRGPVTPIPLVGEGGRPVGALYDQYLLGVVLARQQIAAGQPADATAMAAHPLWRGRTTVIVAYPIDCEGRPNQPLAIRWKMSRPLPVTPQPVGEPVRGNHAQTVLPGVGLPDDALVVNLRNAPMIGAAVEVDYAGPVCHGAAKTVTLPVSVSPGIGLATAFNGIKLPESAASMPSPTVVRLRVTLDAYGRARFPEHLEGPKELGATAIAMLDARSYAPSQTNGVPMPLTFVVPFVFTTTGAPAAVAPYAPPSMAGNPNVMTSTVTTAVPARPTAPPPVLPPAPPGLLETQMARLAIEVAKKGDPVPIPLDAAGPARHGILFDRFLVAAVKARAATVAGQPPDPDTATPDMLQREGLIVVAFPLDCGTRKVAPIDVLVNAGGTQPGAVRVIAPVLTGTELEARLPGVALPAGAVGKVFAHAPFSLNLEVRVTYADAVCSGDGKTATLPIQWVRGTSIRRVSTAKLPPDSTLPSPMAVQMRGLVDLDGAYRFPSVADGPAQLAGAAVSAALEWRFQPYRANGVPTPQSVTAALTFTTTGAPEAPLPPGAPSPPGPPAPPGMANPPPLLTSSTIGGRPSGEFTTDSVTGLTASTSQCAIATTNTYGFAAAGAIKVGGGAAGGPARERQYLNVLRGPAGQGLRIVRRGSTLGPDGETILDVYEITYEGLATPLRIYMDEYHEGVLQAPQGLVCAAPIVVR